MAVVEIQDGFEAALASRTPFVVRGAAAEWPACAWTLEKLRATTETNEPGRYWYDLPPDHPLSEDLAQPAWLAAHWDRLGPRLSLRDRPLRFWLARKGTRTPWHYDGNALDVINVQLSGAKHFALMPPDQEMPWVRFHFVSSLGYEETRAPTLDVTLTAGDLIFVPRFWSHLVRSLDETNSNINWVWTDTAFEADTAVAAREAERLTAIKSLEASGQLGRMLEADEAAFLRQELVEYGGGRGSDLVSAMIDTVTPARVDARIDIEMQNEPSGEFFARLDTRGRELHGRARRADDYFVNA